MKEKFIDLLKETERPGLSDLLLFLEGSDFYRAPASTQHHGACEGGLLAHSIAVHSNLLLVMETFMDDYDPEKAAIVALLHDICKANFYSAEMRNKKIDGRWESVPVYVISDQIPLGHGEKSVILLQQFIPLKFDEIMAIRWHMGGWDDSAKSFGGQQSQSAAMKKYPLITALHMADLAATYFDNK